MKSILHNLIIVCALLGITQAHSQTSFEYLKDGETSSGMQQMFYKNKVLNVGNYTYSCGATINASGNYDMLLTKTDALADTLMWSATYNGGYDGDDYAADLAVDGSNNIIIVGTTQVGTMNYDAITVKYNSSGVQQWASTYAGAAGAPDGLTKVSLRGTDIYVAGGAVVSALQLTDILCIKYNSSGAQQWASTWNNSAANLQDAAVTMRISSSIVQVFGATQEGISPVIWKTAIIKLAASTGALTSETISGGTVSEFSEVKDIAIDDSNNIYVCGAKIVSGQSKNIHIVKYSSSLTEVWSYTKNGNANSDDEGAGIKLSGSDVFISGYISTSGEGRNVFAAKLAQSNGAVAWEIHHHLAGGDDEATDLQLDGSGDLIIPCTLDRNNTKDIGVLKLDKTNGNIIASAYYNSEYNRNEYARDIAVNPANSDVYISAQVQVNDSTYQSRIIKWIFRKVSVPAPTDGYSSYGGYIPNRTQLRETDSTANRTVLFYNQSNAIATYIDNSKISYQLLLANDTTNADTTFRVDMSFAGGKGNAKIYPFNERKEYINYYLGHMDKPSIRTPLSNVILKQGVYTNTDVLFTSSPTGFRHWFLASTGATPSSYQMRFAGQTGLSVDGSGNLVITTTIGNITYKKAKAYSMNTTTGALTLLGWQPSYSISGSTVSFTSIGSWSGTLVLEIDEYKPVTSPSSMVYVQNLEWSTFFGGSGAETNWDVKNDAGGNVWYCGQTSDWIFPENSGTNIGEYHSMDDAYVVHFNNECEAVWFTFYGGWNFDRAYAIALDENKNTYCVGYTLSNDIPMIENTGMDDNTLNGYSDGFFLKLDDAGTILVDSYIGGNGADMAYDIDYRPAGGGMGAAIFIAGSGDSGINFPLQASPSAYGYNQSHAGGYDGFLMRLNGDCELEWSTFFGGSGDDFIYGIANVAGSPAIVGHTKTNYYTANACTEPNDGGFPTCVFPGAWQQPSYQSTHDYNFFIARFDAKDSLKYSTYHGKADLLGNAMRRPQIESFEKYYDSEGKYFFYVSGCTSGEAAADFPFNDWPPFYPNDAYYYTHDSIAYGSLLWLAMLYGNEEFITVEGCTALEWKDHSMNASMAMDKDGGLIITGSSTIQAPQSPANYCFLPTDGEFPLCDQGGTQYMENNLDASNTRSYIMHFDSLMRLDWSTQFGDRPTNFNTCVSSAGEYIFVGGYSLNHYTLLESLYVA